MGSKGWKKYKLSQLSERITKGTTPTTLGHSFVNRGINFIKAESILIDGYIDSSKFVYIDEFTHSRLKRSQLAEGDILFSMAGMVLGKSAVVRKDHLPANTNQALAVIRLKTDKVNPFFVNYFMRQREFFDYVNTSTGQSAQPNINLEEIGNLEIDVPEIETQNRIASILSALDDKIELNRQTNQTLEAIAQAIYKEWFVDFRFPHSPLEGWQAKPDGVDSFLLPCPKGENSLQTTPASLVPWQKNSLFPFWTLPKNRTLQERAKELRKQGILSEVVFWKTFKDKKKLGWDIDRQVIIGNFIVDFFIPELGLIFEIDGSSHNDKQEYDQGRDAFLSSLQLKVVRISDKDVLGNIEGVWRFVTESIKDRVEELKEKNPPRPSGTPQEGKKCEMQDSELGPIPKGWRVGKLGEILKLSNETINPGLYPEMEYFHYSLPAFDNGGIPKIEKGNSILSNKFKVRSYSLLISKLNPRIPRIWPIAVINEEKSICSTEFQVLLPAKNFYSFGIILFSQSAIIETMKSRATGTSGSHQRIKPQDILDIKIIIPDNETLKHYERIVSEHYQRIGCNINESATLAAIRDALLPKLMNGEIEYDGT